jgi:hypothetical protein
MKVKEELENMNTKMYSRTRNPQRLYAKPALKAVMI